MMQVAQETDMKQWINVEAHTVMCSLLALLSYSGSAKGSPHIVPVCVSNAPLIPTTIRV